MATWSHSAGKNASGDRPSSRVRVFERPGRDGIWLSRGWVCTPAGVVRRERLPDGITREAAKNLADRTAIERQAAILEGRTAFGANRGTTVGELLEGYHDSKEAHDWSAPYRRDQDRYRAWWTERFGKSKPVLSITPAEVEKLAGAAAEAHGWSERTHQARLKYLSTATRWGWRKARFYGPADDPLIGLDMPKVKYDTTARIYSEPELRRLLTPHDDVDWRVTLIANIAADTGRRPGAIRQLEVSDLRLVPLSSDFSDADGKGGNGTEGGSSDFSDGSGGLENEPPCTKLSPFLRFRPRIEKTRRGSLAPISETTARLVAAALERESVRETRLLIPGGRVGQKPRYRARPPSTDTLVGMLHTAEETLGIKRVPRRAWYGIKRRHVTAAFAVSAGDSALVGDVTGNKSAELLRNTYRQQELGRLVGHVRAVRNRIGAEQEDAPENAP